MNNKDYYKNLNKLVTRFADKNPLFTRIQDTDPVVNLLKYTSALSVISQNQEKFYKNAKFDYELDIDKNLEKQFNISNTQNYPEEFTLILESSETYPQDVVFNKGITVSYKGSAFTTFEDYSLPTNNTFLEIDIIEGRYVNTNTNLSRINDKGFIELSTDTVSKNHIRVYIDNEEWAKLNNAEFKSGACYSLYNINGVWRIQFSKNYRDLINNNSIITIEYVAPQFTESDQDSGQFNIVTQVYDNDSNLVNNNFKVYLEKSHKLLVLNKISDFIDKLALSYDNALTTEDYTDYTKYYPEVAVARAYDINSTQSTDEDINITTPFIIKVPVTPVSNWYPTKDLKSRIIEYLREIGMNDEDLIIEILDPRYIPVNLEIRVNTTARSEYELTEIRNNITTKLNELFKLGNVEFGAHLDKDNIEVTILSADNRISYIELLGISTQDLGAIELPVLNSLVIKFGYKIVDISESYVLDDKIGTARLLNFDEELTLDDRIKNQVNLSEDMTLIDTTYNGIDMRTQISINASANIRFRDIIVDEVQAQTTIISTLSLDDGYIESVTDDATMRTDVAGQTTTQLVRDVHSEFDPVVTRHTTKIEVNFDEEFELDDSDLDIDKT